MDDKKTPPAPNNIEAQYLAHKTASPDQKSLDNSSFFDKQSTAPQQTETVELSTDPEPQSRSNHKKPRIRRAIKLKNGYLINLGPGFWVFLIITIIFIGLGIGVAIYMWPRTPIAFKVVYLIVFVLKFILTLIMTFSDPGIVRHEKREDVDCLDLDLKCELCFTTKQQKAVHCYDCQICILGWDHHCGFIGKCIGKKNLIFFYLYCVFAVVFFFMCILTAGFSMFKAQN